MSEIFEINEMPQQIKSGVIKLMEQVETATIGHVFHSGFVDRLIGAVLPEKRVAGTAVTIRLPHADSTLLHYLAKLVRPGDFIAIERCGDDRHACWGGVVTNAMKLAGITGAVIDGPATDLSEIRKVGLPLWCRGASPITTKLLNLAGAINVPVTVGGQVITPGDAILGDESGVIVLPADKAESAAKRAIAMQEEELLLLERLRNGELLPDITGVTQMIENNV